MLNSFRLRIALVAALLSGIALAGSATLAWWQVRAARLARIDLELHTLIQREVGSPRTAADWQQTESLIRRILGAASDDDVVTLVTDGHGSIVYRSPQWPAGLGAERLPWPPARPHNAEMRRLPPDPGPAPEWIASDRAPLHGPRSGPPPPVVLSTLDGFRIGAASTPPVRLAIGISPAVLDAEMAPVRRAFLWAMLLALVLIGLGAWIVASRALRPIQRLTRTIGRVSARGLDQRIETAREDREFEELIAVFNAMLERLERSFGQASRFSADAAHELKTPLAILQGQIERAIHEVDDGSPIQARLTGILDEVRRLAEISRKLLLLSQADAGRLNLQRADVDLSAILEELGEDAQMLAPQLAVRSEIESGLVLAADPGLLKQILHNLLSNAIKYNLPGGWIRIAARRREARIEIEFANAAHGIPEAARNQLFERFFRADPAHSRGIEGVGLGLSVSREIARAHGGELRLEDSAADQARFLLTLPERA